MKYPTCTDASVDISASTVTEEMLCVDSSSTNYIFLSLKEFKDNWVHILEIVAK